MNTDDYKQRTEKALEKYYQSQKNRKFDVSGYPVDVQDILLLFCELWNCKPPINKKDKAFWIESSRRLLEACGEFEAEMLHLVRIEFELYMKDNGGLAPFRVGHPAALIKTAQGKASELRTLAENPIDNREAEESAFDVYRRENQ